jgi:hypothetical protein
MTEKIFMTYMNATVISYQGSASTKAIAGLPTRKRLVSFVPAGLVALMLSLAQVPNARADSDTCLAKIKSYVAELDILLLEVKNRLAPYNELSERYFPFRDCEPQALLEVVRGSKFIRSISHHARTDAYFIHFSNGNAIVSFTYYAAEKKSNPNKYNTTWVNK